MSFFSFGKKKPSAPSSSASSPASDDEDEKLVGKDDKTHPKGKDTKPAVVASSSATTKPASTISASTSADSKDKKPPAKPTKPVDSDPEDDDDDVEEKGKKTSTKPGKAPQNGKEKKKDNDNSDDDDDDDDDDKEDSDKKPRKSSVTSSAALSSLPSNSPEVTEWITMKLDLKGKEKEEKMLKDDEEDEDADRDKDEFRRKNRTVTKSNDITKEQKLLWCKFRIQLPVPMKSIVSTGACIALRKSLMNNRNLVLNGIPPYLRRSVWEMASLARVYPERLEHIARYKYYLGLSPIPVIAKEIERDTSRAMRGHAKFLGKQGQKELNDVLIALSLHAPSIGYCNSILHIAAFLLLFYSPERAFWILCSVIDNVLPTDYFTNSLLGVRSDCQLIKILLYLRMPKLFQHLTDQNVHIEVYSLRWLMSLFIITLPFSTCVKIFDMMILESCERSRQGSNVLIRIALAIFVLKRQELMELEAEQLYDALEAFDSQGSKKNPVSGHHPSVLQIDGEELIRVANGNKCKLLQEDLDRRDAERKIMEIEYMKELQFSLKYKRQEEERRKKEEDEEKKKKEKELESLQYGTEMWKIPHTGKPKKVNIYLTKEGKDTATGEDQYVVSWDSKKKTKNDSQMKLKECAVFFGVTHGLFKQRPDIAKSFTKEVHLAFSLINYDRSLDLVATSLVDFDQWYDALMVVPMKEREKIDRLAMAADVRNKERKEREEKERREREKEKKSHPDKDKEKEKEAEKKKKAKDADLTDSEDEDESLATH